jgi:hypothetical protein
MMTYEQQAITHTFISHLVKLIANMLSFMLTVIHQYKMTQTHVKYCSSFFHIFIVSLTISTIYDFVSCKKSPSSLIKSPIIHLLPYDLISMEKLSEIVPMSMSYQVFINHRGPNMKKTLTIIIYHHLKNYGLSIFIHKNELLMGDISPLQYWH